MKLMPVTISDCFHCNNCSMRGASWRCYAKSKKGRELWTSEDWKSVYFRSIPPWCPLPDAPEDKQGG